MKYTPGNWLRVAKGERWMWGDNIIYIDSVIDRDDEGDEKYKLIFFWDWEVEKFLWDEPKVIRSWASELGGAYEEYGEREMIASIFEEGFYPSEK